MYIPEIDEIYFPKTREYFKEVISSYSVGNYRSTIVMLYSVAICDLLFKLTELKDMYNDAGASSILEEVDKQRENKDNNSKTSWERTLIDCIYKKTKLLDDIAYTNLLHLRDYRNFSAHPSLNSNYELITPSQEKTIAFIKSTLIDILTKPPIFIKNIVETLTEDLKDKRELYLNEYQKLIVYLENKYYSKMTESMKYAVVKAFWKFCFCLPDDENCRKNMAINRKALEILLSTFPEKAIAYIQENTNQLQVANDKNCLMNLVQFISRYPELYKVVNPDVKLQIDKFSANNVAARLVSWYRFSTAIEYFEDIKHIEQPNLDEQKVIFLTRHWSECGNLEMLIDYFIWHYGKSNSYNAADERFEVEIKPFLMQMNKDQYKKLFEVSNANNQIYGRGLAVRANTLIIACAKKKFGLNLDVSNFENIQYGETNISDIDDLCDEEHGKIRANFFGGKS